MAKKVSEMSELEKLKAAEDMAFREYESAYDEDRDDYLDQFDSWVFAKNALRSHIARQPKTIIVANPGDVGRLQFMRGTQE